MERYKNNNMAKKRTIKIRDALNLKEKRTMRIVGEIK